MIYGFAFFSVFQQTYLNLNRNDAEKLSTNGLIIYSHTVKVKQTFNAATLC